MRAERLRETLGGDATVVECDASVGGGAFPAARIPSIALAFRANAQALESRLRTGETAVIGRIADDRLLLDLRTVQPNEDDALARALRAALSS